MSTSCPTHIDVPSFIKRIAGGNLRGAARTILEANPLGGMCARVCPTEVLCEQVCVRQAQEGKPVAIGRLQRDLQAGELDQRTGKTVSASHANWTMHPNNPMRTVAA